MTVKPQATLDFSASADICQLLSHQRGPAMSDAQLPSNVLLQKTLSAGQAQNLSPTCHFSGLSGEFMTSSGIQTLPSCPAAFGLIDMNSAKASSHGGFQGPIQGAHNTFMTQPLSSENAPFHVTQMTPMAMPNSHSFNQAMDSFPSLSQGRSVIAGLSLNIVSSR